MATKRLTKAERGALQSMRGHHRCDLCDLQALCIAHHVYHRGIGGGSELNHPLNLLGLCNLCHRRCHEKTEGRFFSRAEQWDAVAVREGYPGGQWVEEEVFRLLRQPKGSLR